MTRKELEKGQTESRFFLFLTMKLDGSRAEPAQNPTRATIQHLDRLLQQILHLGTVLGKVR